MNEEKPTLQQCMLRVKDPKKALDFYVNILGFTLVAKYDFPQYKFSLYFLATLPDGVALPTKDPSSKENKAWLWSYSGTVLELTHNHGTESKDEFQYHNSNDPFKPRGGFGHVAVNTEDVYKLSKTLASKGISFKKKPDEGRMKGLAFAYDADRNWVEIVERSEKYAHKNLCNFSQIMLRIKDPKKSVPFYRDLLKMTVVREIHFPKEKGDFSLYFMATLTPEQRKICPDPTSPAAREFVKTLHNPVLELTHNHGTEISDEPSYHTGNSDNFSFGHIGFLVNDVYTTCDKLEKAGVAFHKKPDDGTMKGLAFALDPDGYRIELIKRGWKPPF